MAWIESHQSLSRHRKTLRVVALLKADRHKVLGHLHQLWWWGLDNASTDGTLGHVTAEEIALGAEWPVTQADRFVDALLEAGGADEPGFLERLADGRYVLHDWHAYAGKLNERRDRERERSRSRRGKEATRPPDDRGPTDGPPRNGQRSNRRTTAGTGPNLTGPDRKETDVSAEPAFQTADLVEGRTDADDALEVFDYYKARVQPLAREFPRKKIAMRLRRYSAEELRRGIDNFASDAWWMENCASRGAGWFFDSDARAEQFLLLTPRPRVVSIDVGTTARRSSLDERMRRGVAHV